MFLFSKAKCSSSHPPTLKVRLGDTPRPPACRRLFLQANERRRTIVQLAAKLVYGLIGLAVPLRGLSASD